MNTITGGKQRQDSTSGICQIWERASTGRAGGSTHPAGRNWKLAWCIATSRANLAILWIDRGSIF
jgi:hypothetical protein